MANSFFKEIIKQQVYKKYLNLVGVFRYFGEQVFFPKYSTTFKLAIRDGIYEHEILKFLVHFVKDDSVYLDIGANIGLMSIPVLAKNPSVKVLSFEASPSTFGYLKKTWDRSKYKDRWVVYNNAVSDSNMELDFFIAKDADGAYESMKDTKRVNFSGTIKVPGITVDTVWNDLNKPNVSVIKSDIEGADLLALRGATSCISECKPIIVLEWNNVNIEPFQFKNEDLMEFCKNLHYQCYALPSLISVDNVLELDLQNVVTENYLLMPIDKIK